MMIESTDLVRMLLTRRSCRSYGEGPVDDDALDAVEGALTDLPTVGGLQSGRSILIRDPDRANAIFDALMTGLVGKANIWLARGPRPPALVLCIGDPDLSPRSEGRYLYNIDAALSGEAAVIAAAGRGLDSLWMAGIGEREVHRVAKLPEGIRTVAVIALGRSRRRMSLFDGLTQRMLSGKRKPLSSRAFEDRFGSVLPIAGPDPTRRQQMAELAGGPWDGPSMDVRIGHPTAVFEGAPDGDRLRTLLDAARWAPNADNAQIWRWVVVRDPDRQREVLSASGVADAADAGDFVLVAGCAAPFFIKGRTRQQPFALIDVPIAAAHQIVVADAMGHGYNMLVDIDHGGARTALGVPEDHEVACLMMFGKPGRSNDVPHWQQLRSPTRKND